MWFRSSVLGATVVFLRSRMERNAPTRDSRVTGKCRQLCECMASMASSRLAVSSTVAISVLMTSLTGVSSGSSFSSTTRRMEQSVRALARVLALEEAEQPPAVVLEFVEAMVDVRADAPHRPPVAPGDEVLGLRVREERIVLPVKALAHVGVERRDPAGLVTIEIRGQGDEAPHVAPIGDRAGRKVRG